MRKLMFYLWLTADLSRVFPSSDCWKQTNCDLMQQLWTQQRDDQAVAGKGICSANKNAPKCLSGCENLNYSEKLALEASLGLFHQSTRSVGKWELDARLFPPPSDVIIDCVWVPSLKCCFWVGRKYTSSTQPCLNSATADIKINSREIRGNQLVLLFTGLMNANVFYFVCLILGWSKIKLTLCFSTWRSQHLDWLLGSISPPPSSGWKQYFRIE